MKNLHVINRGHEKFILFFPQSLRFFVANKDQVEQFTDVSENKDCINYLQDDEYNYASKLLTETLSITASSHDSTVLPRLVLNISNDCNLRCKYCYAAGGSYSGSRKLMSLDTLHATLESFFKHFNRVEIIQLFGGEPAMNIPAIRSVCDYIRTGSYSTNIGIVTNGTIMTDELLDLIKANDIHVTISIDVESLHDKMRPFASGEGSFDTIKKNISKLKIAGQPEKLEVTYTQLHDKQDMTIHNIVSELNHEFGINDIHIAPVSTINRRYKLSNNTRFVEAVDDFLMNPNLNLHPHAMLNTMLRMLKTKQPTQYICFAGFGTIAVSADGIVYPCFYFCENADFMQGSVYDSQEMFSASIWKMQKQYLKYSRYKREECSECFAMNLCRGCLGVNYCETGDKYRVPEKTCEMIRGTLEKVLVNLSN